MCRNIPLVYKALLIFTVYLYQLCPLMGWLVLLGYSQGGGLLSLAWPVLQKTLIKTAGCVSRIARFIGRFGIIWLGF
jgi:hypothetical protein